MIAPGATIGILGGGQLGRMTALAAARLGYRCHVFCPEPDPPAGQVTPLLTRGNYEDRAAVAAFAATCDVVTYEFENIALAAVEAAATAAPVRPDARALAVAQDRIAEKTFANGLGIPTAPWRSVREAGDLSAALAAIGAPALLKTARMGYDGKGQALVQDAAQAMAAWARFGHVACVLEGLVDFACEVSVIVARGPDGGEAAYDAVENRHKQGILDETIAPARIVATVGDEAKRIALTLARGLDLVGVLAVEMFVTRDGRVLVNEMAPRPHNSGHWTIDACATSQFEQLVRAICGLPLGSPARFADAVMTNLIGNDVDDWPKFIAEPGARLHLYGKAEARPGRKMGHVTRLNPR